MGYGFSNNLEKDYTETLEELRKAHDKLTGELKSIERNGINEIKWAQIKADKEIQEKKNTNLELQLKAQLERVKRVERAELDALNNIARTRLDIEETLTEIATERIARSERAEALAINDIKKTELEIERAITDLAKERAKVSSGKFSEYAIGERRLQQLRDQQELQSKINKELIKYDADADSKKGKKIAKRLETEAAYEATDKRAKEYVSDIPLIGKKLGERGYITDMFKNMTRFTDADGKSWTEKTARANLKKTKAETSSMLTDEEKAGRKSKEFKSYEASKKEEDRLAKSIAKAQSEGKDTNKLEAKLAEQKEKTAKLEGKTGLSKEQIGNIETADELDKEAEDKVKGAKYSGLANVTAALANIAQQLEPLYDDIAAMKSQVDTRLYGSGNKTFFDSYWSKIQVDFSALIASPLVKQEELYKSVLTVVDAGIARDVEQVAMLNVIKDKIATTFNAFDGTMLRLIRIQDTNTTAARLGMEASLNEFMNQMYSTTEYLKDLASSVRSDLNEAQALMDASDAVEFEYQVQKWMGSLYSVGMSQSGVSAISSSLGKLAAGDIEGIVNGGAGNLLIMAANNANLSIADILADGLDASETNTLLNSAVEYMSDLVDEANGNKVVQQQLAKVFGVTASDLKSVKNIIENDNYAGVTTATIAGTNQTYGSLIGNLYSMANSMYSRTSVGEMITNAMANVKYSTAAGVASNPVLYITNKVANILDSFAGGIPLPAVSVLGNGVDTKLTVSNIMKSAAMVGGFTQSLIAAIASGGNGFTGSGLLDMVGLSNTGGGGSKVARGASTSNSKVLNASSTDMTDSATQEGKDSANEQQVSAKEESTEITNEDINNNIVNIYQLLKDVIDGTSQLSVNVKNTVTTQASTTSSAVGSLIPSFS